MIPPAEQRDNQEETRMENEGKPMEKIRGTILLCDYLCQGQGGKWIIVGTFTVMAVPPGKKSIEFPDGINVYVRFQVEKIGPVSAEILLVNRIKASNEPALQRIPFEIQVENPNVPIEVPCKLLPFSIKCPDENAKEPQGMRLLVWLKVNGVDVASCPLDLIFLPNQGGKDDSSSHLPTEL